MTAAILVVFALLSAFLTIRADNKCLRRQVYVFKPLTMAFIIGIALTAGPTAGLRYQWLITAGLGLSLIGDVFMMLPKKGFTQGLSCFLAAHICYIGAFLSGLRFHFSIGPFIPLIAFAFFLLWILYPRLGKMKIPVIFYILVILVMVQTAMGRFIQLPGPRSLCVMAGALAFLVSDSVLALNRFVKSLKWAQVIILTTYFSAQILIALSI